MIGNNGNIWIMGIYYLYIYIFNMNYAKFMTFHILGIMIPTDFHSIIFQRGRSTPNQIIAWCITPS